MMFLLLLSSGGRVLVCVRSVAGEEAALEERVDGLELGREDGLELGREPGPVAPLPG